MGRGYSPPHFACTEGLSMDKLKIAVLDSGFDFYRPLQNPIIYNASFSDEESPIDQNGHGSCIIKLLDSIGPDLEFYNMAVLNKNKVGKLSSLKRALAESVEQNVNIINLSLGIENSCVDFQLEDILQKCIEKNIFLITAGSNSGKRNYLTSYSNILSIQGQNQTTKSRSPSQACMFCVDNMPRIVPWIYGSYKLSGANSFLTPFLIKKLRLIYQERNSFPESINTLLKLSASDILKVPSSTLFYQRKEPIDKKLLEQILSFSVISDLYNNQGALLMSNASIRNITHLVQLIEAITNKPYKFDSVWLSDIVFVENLANRLYYMEKTDYEQENLS